jgi:hypothetical protein
MLVKPTGPLAVAMRGSASAMGCKSFGVFARDRTSENWGRGGGCGEVGDEKGIREGPLKVEDAERTERRR